MVYRGPNGLYAFVPSFVAAPPGDTVKVVATDRGQADRAGPLRLEAVWKRSSACFQTRCAPYLAIGMVALIQVGKPVNRAAIAAGSVKLPALAGNPSQPAWRACAVPATACAE